MQVCEYASMRVCKYVQPGEYVRFKGVDVHAYSYRPARADPNIRKSEWSSLQCIDPIVCGLHCNYLGLQYKYVKFQLRSEVPAVRVQILWSSSDAVGFFLFSIVI